MSLADLPTMLLLPPVNCLAAACAGAVLGRRRIGRILLWGGLGGLVLLSMPFVSGWLIVSLEGGLDGQPGPGVQPGAVVILSGDQVELQGGPNDYRVGHLTLEREQAGVRVARATGLPILVSGGVLRPGAPSLASLMARSLQADFGMTPKWLEQRSQDTWQNAAYSANLLRQDGIGTVYVVSHAWHLRRALIAFRAAGLQAVPAPVYPTRAPRLEPGSFIPRVSAWQESYYALHEWIGCAWYALRG
jgi:uncharacterized SAM-binding protein YcdF (DUF218 family)